NFYSSKFADQSVLALATDPKNKLLVSGDTRGWIYIWDIQTYCLTPNKEEASDCTPALLFSWMAHEATVVSLDVITMSYGTFVLSASTDRTARLWTTEGHFVGTFGQEDKWNLRDSSTYQHPRHVCYVYILDNERSDIKSTVSVDDNDTRNSKGHTSKSATSRPVVPSIQLNGPITKASQDSNHPPTFGTDSPQQLSPIEPSTPSGKVDSPTTVRSQTPDLTISRLNCSDLVDDEESNHNESKFKRTVRSAPSVLGRHVERNLARITQSRKQRREMYSLLKDPAGLTYGNQCVPFKALVTPETEEVDFLATLPMSPRMQQQGLLVTSASDLQKLSFEDNNSFRLDEKPVKERKGRPSTYFPKV
ncbi:putative WD repeat-containing protein 49-like, partial [Apostichopus japonicus]